MLNIGKKRKEIDIRADDLTVIKMYLSDDFKRVDVRDITNIAELSDMILYGIHTVVKAKIDASNTIHIRIEDVNGFLFEGFTENYAWFIKTFFLKD